jgi:hypothetical protein
VLPDRLRIPDVPVWRRGYPRRAAEAGQAVPGFDDAVHLVQALGDSVCFGQVFDEPPRASTV